MPESRSARQGERGVTLAIMALMLSLALGMSALAIDYGMIKSAKAEDQRAMDAAALAGASAFVEPDPDLRTHDEATRRALEYAAKHTVHQVPIDTSKVKVTFPGERQITASYSTPGIRLWFATLFGATTMGVNAAATAEASVEGKSVDCVKPFLLPDMWFESDKATQDVNKDNIWQGDTDNEEFWEYQPESGDRYVPYDPNASSSDQALQTGLGSDFRSSGDKYAGDYGLPMMLKPQTGTSPKVSMFYLLMDLDKNLNTEKEIGTCTKLGVGDEVTPIKPGGTTGQVKHGIDDLVAEDPDASWDDSQQKVVGSKYGDDWSQSPRVITVALFDPVFIKDGNVPNGGNSAVSINNFALLWIDAVDGNDNVTGHFVGPALGGSKGDEVGSLVFVLRLIK